MDSPTHDIKRDASESITGSPKKKSKLSSSDIEEKSPLSQTGGSVSMACGESIMFTAKEVCISEYFSGKLMLELWRSTKDQPPETAETVFVVITNIHSNDGKDFHDGQPTRSSKAVPRTFSNLHTANEWAMSAFMRCAKGSKAPDTTGWYIQEGCLRIFDEIQEKNSTISARVWRQTIDKEQIIPGQNLETRESKGFTRGIQLAY